MTGGNIFETQDGSHSIFSERYGVSYHSKYGAIQESLHVFINAGLRNRALGHSALAILEIGFGTGLNAYLSLLEATTRKLNIYYETVEAYPISNEQAAQLNYPMQISAQADQAELFMQLHTSDWEKEHVLSPHFTFRKTSTTVEAYDPPPRFDIIYFDAFAPDAQPELWGEAIFEKMYKALLPDGILVTYCAKGVVKRCLRSVGFEIESIPGPPGKREMTRCTKPSI